MRTKNNNGFTLIESMIAIAIVGFVLTPIFVLQTNVFSSALRVADRFHRNVQAAQFSFIAYRQQPPTAKDFKLERKEDKPTSTLRYAFEPVAKASSLAKEKGMYRQEVIAVGPDRDSPEGQSIHFIFKQSERAA